jgi:hypothetical protein
MKGNNRQFYLHMLVLTKVVMITDSISSLAPLNPCHLLQLIKWLREHDFTVLTFQPMRARFVLKYKTNSLITATNKKNKISTLIYTGIYI